MAYQVLARKYRPQRFSDVVGQDHVTVTLMNALTQQRIAHGYIFSGHRGIGKTTIARILAMALNCRNTIGSELRPSAEPCEVCDSCVEIKAGNAVDVIEIDAATNRGIDEIRELRDAARYRPSRDKYKIYILDEAHQITDAAFNALLKTLEEPPDHIVFMMATTQPEDIPQTVRSRCQHYSFHAVKLADILGQLRMIAGQENIDADDTALSLLAEAGDGSMRDALSIMDQAIASAPVRYSDDGTTVRAMLDPGQIRELMGTVPNAVFERILEAVNANQSAEVITVANQLLDAGNSPAQLARQCVRYLRNCLIAKISGLTPDGSNLDGPAAELLQISIDEQRRAARSAALFSEEELTRFLQTMLRTFDELGYRQEQRFHFELGLLKLVHLRRLLPIEEVLSKFASASAGSGSGGSGSGSGGNTTQSQTAASKPASASVRPAAATAPMLAPATARAASASPFAPPPSSAFTPLPSIPRPVAPAPRVAAPPVPPSTAAVREPAQPEPMAKVAVTVPAQPQTEAIAAQSELDQTAVTIAEPAIVQAAHEAENVLPEAEDVLLEAEDVADAAASQTAPDALAETLQRVAVEALASARSQSSAADAVSDATFALAGEMLQIETQLSKLMLPTVINPEAEKLVRAAILAHSPGLRITLMPNTNPAAANAAAAKKPRTARSGSAQAKALEHPIVLEAQRLFNAEIRNVIDLTES